VTLPLRLADVKLDLKGNGVPTDKLLDILKKLMPANQFDFLKGNPEFLVKFDRGDVAWLRAYCHLLSAMLDIYLAIDGKFIFDMVGNDHFEKPKGQSDQRPDLFSMIVKISDPGRLHSFRKHMLKVCELNRETWRFIRAERNDDHEWLPSPKQKGVLGIPVTDEMIDGWLQAIGELEGLLKGDKLLVPGFPVEVRNGSGFNLKTFLDDPPAKLEIQRIMDKGIDDRYLGKLTDANQFDDRVFNRVMAMFGDSMRVAYAAWFN
jgi:hypothetical protein